jgi:hypothetical protein
MCVCMYLGLRVWKVDIFTQERGIKGGLEDTA